jgi:hypothetical protein
MLSVALALSGVLPAAGTAVAQEPDQEREGSAAPEPTPPDSTADPDFDPGGETGLPFNLELRGGGGDDDSSDGAPVDVEPVTDPDAPAVAPDDSTALAPDAIEGTDEPAPPAEAVQPTPLPAPAPAPTTPPPAATAPMPDADQRAAGDRRRAAPTRKRQRDREPLRRAITVTLPATAVPPSPAPAPVVTTPTVETAPTTTEPRSRARSGQGSHTVQSGESLWRIASDLLGSGATDAEIAAESNRLFGLNRDRIGDDPNMLIAGTVLRLR